MAGKPGRSGRPRKPLSYHVLAGSYRPDRHGPLPANVAVMPAASVAGWQPTEAQRAGLGVAGRALMDDVLGAYEPSLVDGLQLLEAARAADVLATLRAEAVPICGRFGSGRRISRR